MEDQVTPLKAKLFDKTEIIEGLEHQLKEKTELCSLFIKTIQSKLEITDEQLKDYGNIEEFLKELQDACLVKEETEIEDGSSE